MSDNRQKYEPIARELASSAGVDPDLVLGVIRQESDFNPAAVSKAGALGMMQLMPGTASGLGVTDPLDPIQNMKGGIKYLGNLLKKFGSPELALAAYNAGPGAVQKYGGIPPYAETQNYVKAILGKQGSSSLSSNLLKSPSVQKSDPRVQKAANEIIHSNWITNDGLVPNPMASQKPYTIPAFQPNIPSLPSNPLLGPMSDATQRYINKPVQQSPVQNFFNSGLNSASLHTLDLPESGGISGLAGSSIGSMVPAFALSPFLGPVGGAAVGFSLGSAGANVRSQLHKYGSIQNIPSLIGDTAIGAVTPLIPGSQAENILGRVGSNMLRYGAGNLAGETISRGLSGGKFTKEDAKNMGASTIGISLLSALLHKPGEKVNDVPQSIQNRINKLLPDDVEVGDYLKKEGGQLGKSIPDFGRTGGIGSRRLPPEPTKTSEDIINNIPDEKMFVNSNPKSGEATTFTTGKGSSYTVDKTSFVNPETGQTLLSTQRTKSLHVGHDAGDTGLKELSHYTVFVKPEDIGPIQDAIYTRGNKSRSIKIEGLDLVVERNGNETRIPFAVDPEVGLHPFEALPNDKFHLGNEVTAVSKAEPVIPNENTSSGPKLGSDGYTDRNSITSPTDQTFNNKTAANRAAKSLGIQKDSFTPVQVGKGEWMIHQPSTELASEPPKVPTQNEISNEGALTSEPSQSSQSSNQKFNSINVGKLGELHDAGFQLLGDTKSAESIRPDYAEGINESHLKPVQDAVDTNWKIANGELPASEGKVISYDHTANIKGRTQEGRQMTPLALEYGNHGLSVYGLNENGHPVHRYFDTRPSTAPEHVDNHSWFNSEPKLVPGAEPKFEVSTEKRYKPVKTMQKDKLASDVDSFQKILPKNKIVQRMAKKAQEGIIKNYDSLLDDYGRLKNHKDWDVLKKQMDDDLDVRSAC